MMLNIIVIKIWNAPNMKPRQFIEKQIITALEEHVDEVRLPA